MHTAIIMDGNGRWAFHRSLPRLAGHRQGAEAVRRVVEAAPHCGISDLTLFAFSSDNWRRPAGETSGLLELFADFLALETARCIENGVKLSVIGRRDRLPLALLGAIAEAERATGACRRLHLRIAVDYSSRDSIRRATSRRHGSAGTGVPDVDLLIRTGGERRLSDFLLWESAYAELVFLEVTWPEFTARHLEAAMEEYRNRHRRFGTLPAGYCGISA